MWIGAYTRHTTIHCAPGTQRNQRKSHRITSTCHMHVLLLSHLRGFTKWLFLFHFLPMTLSLSHSFSSLSLSLSLLPSLSLFFLLYLTLFVSLVPFSFSQDQFSFSFLGKKFFLKRCKIYVMKKCIQGKYLMEIVVTFLSIECFRMDASWWQ